MAAISTRLPAPLNEWHSPYPAMAKELREAAADLAALKYEVLKKVGDAVATLKHLGSKNADYGAAEQYLLFEHDEFTMKPVLDENGRLIPP